MNIGNRIKELRKKLNMSNRELASKAGLSQPVMNRLENNERKCDIETLEKICEALNITLLDFFAPTGNTAPLTEDLRELVASAKDLSPEQIQLLSSFLKSIK